MGHAFAAEALKKDLGDLRTEVVPSREDGFHSCGEMPARVGFQDIAMGSGLDDLVDQALGIVNRKNQDLGFRAELEDLACGVNAVQTRHADIEDCDIGMQLFTEGNGIPARGSLSAEIDIFFGFEDVSNALTNHLMVISNQDLDDFIVGHARRLLVWKYQP